MSSFLETSLSDSQEQEANKITEQITKVKTQTFFRSIFFIKNKVT
jgi:hypothetical protein